MAMDYAYFDGACEPRNPGGYGGWGFALFEAEGRLLKDGFGVMAARTDMTCNVAEYAAAGAAVKAYRDLGRPGPLLIMGDSQLVVRQMNREWSVRHGAYVPVYQRLVQLLETCNFQITWKWIPRRENTIADELSTRGLRKIGITRNDWTKKRHAKS